MPPLPESADKRAARLHVRIRPPLLHLVKATAARKCLTVSELTRSLLRREAREELGIRGDEEGG